MVGGCPWIKLFWRRCAMCNSTFRVKEGVHRNGKGKVQRGRELVHVIAQVSGGQGSTGSKRVPGAGMVVISAGRELEAQQRLKIEHLMRPSGATKKERRWSDFQKKNEMKYIWRWQPDGEKHDFEKNGRKVKERQRKVDRRLRRLGGRENC